MLDRPRRPRQQSRRPDHGRRKRPAKPEPTSRTTLWLGATVVVLLLLILVNRASREPAAAPAPAPVAQESMAPLPPPPPPAPLPPPVVTPSAGTPTLDLMVRLEAHRRIVRAGRAVYLDSLLAESDSLLRRWPERPGEWVTVGIIPDSMAATVPDGLAILRDAFARWQDLTPGVHFRVGADTAGAQVLVQWIDQFDPEERRTGETDIVFSQDGTIHQASITLAVRTPEGQRLDRAAMLRTAVHEVGHAIGLAHSADPGDVMYPFPRTANLSERDRRTVSLIYGLPAGSVKGG